MPDASPLEPLVHDWNGPFRLPARRIELLDETLRDGLQSPSVVHPTLDRKIELLGLMAEVGVDVVKVGMPAVSARVFEDAVALSRAAVANRRPLRVACAARALPEDVARVAEVSERAGVPVDAYVFVASSTVRAAAEGWDRAAVRALGATAIDAARRAGLTVAFVAEDATRASPEGLSELFRLAIEHGATRLCLCDTAGYATPEGAAALVRFSRRIVEESGATVAIDWHGHDDRGLGVANALAAIEAGVDRVHATALGVGERAGNVAMELLIVNLALSSASGDRNPGRLLDYCRAASRMLDWPIPRNHPVVGRDAFRTATGTHAAAIAKAEERGDAWLVDHVYSAVPAAWIGREQEIGVGVMSGSANAVHWLGRHGLAAEPDLVRAIVRQAKLADRLLTDAELWDVVRRFREGAKKVSGDSR